MTLNKGQNIIKYCVLTSAAALVLIAVNTLLIVENQLKMRIPLILSSKAYEAI